MAAFTIPMAESYDMRLRLYLDTPSIFVERDCGEMLSTIHPTFESAWRRAEGRPSLAAGMEQQATGLGPRRPQQAAGARAQETASAPRILCRVPRLDCS